MKVVIGQDLRENLLFCKNASHVLRVQIQSSKKLMLAIVSCGFFSDWKDKEAPWYVNGPGAGHHQRQLPEEWSSGQLQIAAPLWPGISHSEAQFVIIVLNVIMQTNIAQLPQFTSKKSVPPKLEGTPISCLSRQRNNEIQFLIFLLQWA
jgi:hypothetical protein